MVEVSLKITGSLKQISAVIIWNPAEEPFTLRGIKLVVSLQPKPVDFNIMRIPVLPFSKVKADFKIEKG